jgi:abortive infection bacteriophage resistance protein
VIFGAFLRLYFKTNNDTIAQNTNVGDAMNNSDNKPKKFSTDLARSLYEDKGITFKYLSQEKAADYFSNQNNYMRTACYRKNYEKHTTGDNIGKYIHLDIAYLTELSTIDMHLRFLLLKMCLDVEHAMKVKILSEIEKDPDENGYHIVSEFLAKNPSIVANIEGKSDSIFTGNLIEQNFELCYVFEKNIGNIRTKIAKIDCPIWILVEIISFGDLIQLYNFYQAQRQRIKSDKNVMNAVKSLRNACAHNNCIINDLHSKNTKPPKIISTYISNIKNIGKDERRNKLSCRPLFEIVCLIYVYEKIVSQKIKKHRMSELKDLINDRMTIKKDFFKDNQLLTTSYHFLKKVIDNVH